VLAPEVVAVRSDPAEAVPGKPVQYTALYIGPQGPIETGAVDWAFCNERKPLAELEPVSPLCLEATGSWLVELGVGGTIAGTVPAMACSQFGPSVPQPQPNQPPGRPVDPDFTGGYYQPVRVLAAGAHGDIITSAETRIACGSASVSPDVVAEFAQRYHVNGNPKIASFGPKGGAPWIDATQPGNAGMTNAVAAGSRFTLEVTWPTCPQVDACGDGYCGPDETPMSCASCDASIALCPQDCAPLAQCGGAERYVVLDQETQTLGDAREGIGVAWFTTDGSFDVDQTGRQGTDPATFSDNGWTAPSHAGVVTMWVVLRDDRGGNVWGEYVLQIQ
jgi:hypothetical protein